MEILFWLVPAAVVTLAAMVGVGWWGRESKGVVSDAGREAAARKLGEALSREQSSRPGYAVPPRTPDRASGVAVRPSKARPVVLPGSADEPAVSADDQPTSDRRAS
ncbi:hypothetical protein [Nocardioides sp. WS12]|uniref:hypothetical protein n=1 Tax=Nocardioides sp. WS12 TaxID=2486272 RepID=UPI0015FBF97D|nr:hypothetical protein [Nocardioides sp. WS12]